MTTTTVAIPRHNPIPNSKSSDEEIDAFHDRIRTRLLNEEAALLSEARDMQHEAARMMADARRLRNEAQASRWYNLHGSLTHDEIESLCGIDPVRLLDE